MSFKNKVVIITGASSGIGAAAAIAFNSEGAHVVMVGRNEEKLSTVAKKCKQPLVIEADVTKGDDAKKIIEQTIEKFGELHVLVNVAGTITLSGSLLMGDILKSYDLIMSVNLRAAVHLSSLAAPHLVKTKGNIINISSIGGRTTPFTPGSINYAISKAALNHFTTCAAGELAPLGVRVNAISPGPVKTDFLSNTKTSYTWHDLVEWTVLNRVSEPEEIADLVLFLAGDKAKGITGSNYFIDNGALVKRTN